MSLFRLFHAFPMRPAGGPLLACLLTTAFHAQGQLPEAPVSASLEVDPPSPFVKETFTVTLTIETRDVEIRQQLDLVNLPDPARLSIFTPFEALPIQRETDGHRSVEIRRYRARARAPEAGPVILEPALRLTAQRRVRSFFGSMVEEQPLTIGVTPVALHVKPLPAPPADFTGAIGDLGVDVSVGPTELAPGDLVTVDIRLDGEGWLDNLRMPRIADAPGLKTYPPTEVQASPVLRRFTQTVIPQSSAVTGIPPVAVTLFNTRTGAYETREFGPFPLRYRQETPRMLEHFRPEDGQGRPLDAGKPGIPGRIRSLLRLEQGEPAVTGETVHAALAPSPGSLATFRLPQGTPVRILQRHGTYVLVSADKRRGWIPGNTLLMD